MAGMRAVSSPDHEGNGVLVTITLRTSHLAEFRLPSPRRPVPDTGLGFSMTRSVHSQTPDQVWGDGMGKGEEPSVSPRAPRLHAA